MYADLYSNMLILYCNSRLCFTIVIDGVMEYNTNFIELIILEYYTV